MAAPGPCRASPESTQPWGADLPCVAPTISQRCLSSARCYQEKTHPAGLL